MTANSNAIEVQGLTKIYRKYSAGDGIWNMARSFVMRKYEDVRAVDDVSFRIESGTCVGLLGANGAGKTTLVKMMAGLLTASEGNATVLGFNPAFRDNEFLSQIGVVMGQRQQLWIDVSAFENLRLNQVVYGISEADFKSRLKSLSQMLDVESLLHTQVRKLSLGEKMKMELLAAFLHKPKLLFLDEPTIGLDVVAQDRIRKFIHKRVEEDGVTVLLTSHYLKDLEELCPRVLLIQHGKIVHDGSLASLTPKIAGTRRVVWIMRTDPASKLDPEVKALNPTLRPDGHHFIEVPSKEIPKVIKLLMSTTGIEDLSIEAPPLEESIRRLMDDRHES